MMWAIFFLIIAAMLAIDLGVSSKKTGELTFKESVIWSVIWIGVAMGFCGFLWLTYGHHHAIEFLTGYVIEKSLSVDNIFVFVMLFKAFSIPTRLQHKVLFWGIFGAIVMRALFVAFGIAAIHLFHPIIYVFGIFLIFTGVKMAISADKAVDVENNAALRLLKRFFPIDDTDNSGRFVIKRHGSRFVTRLFVVLVVVEFTDLLFAVDSIPAILAISKDPFIVFSSNIFAILGLRALYFSVASAVDKFHYLSIALSAILSFVGVKMVISDWVHIPTIVSLGTILGILSVAIGASIYRNRYHSA